MPTQPLYASDATINHGEPYRNYIEEETEASKTPPSSMLPTGSYIPTAPDQTYSEQGGQGHFVDQSGGIYPIMHNSVLFDLTPQQQAARSQPRMTMQDYLTSVQPPGGWTSVPDYKKAVNDAIKVVAQSQNVNLNTDTGNNWRVNTLKEADQQAGDYIMPLGKDEVREVGNGTLISLRTHQPIYTSPMDQMMAHAFAAGTHDPSGNPVQPPDNQGQGGQGQPPNPTGYITPNSGNPAQAPQAQPPAQAPTTQPNASNGAPQEDQLTQALRQLPPVLRAGVLKKIGATYDPTMPKISTADVTEGGKYGLSPTMFRDVNTGFPDTQAYLQAVGAAKQKQATQLKPVDKSDIDKINAFTELEKTYDDAINKAQASPTTFGPLQGMAADVKSKTLGNTPAETEALRAVNSLKAEKLHEVYGSRLTSTELDFAHKYMVDENTPYSNVLTNLNAAKTEVQAKKQNLLNDLQAGGRDVRQYLAQGQGQPQNGQPQPPQGTNDHTQAIQWALANPKNPKAAQILQAALSNLGK